ncbi:MAG TPA: ABC transporter substrate-binding protein [Candidatus Binatia bacterium]|jgi:NitT/TauT family transport system substrate-binding protein|nr:ABC transporter substrate-binding protein [Candidatus Binatia bacterium]
MNRATVTFLWRLVVFSLLLARPVSIRAADPMIVGVAGPAINMVYSFVARDAGLFQRYGIDARIVIFDAGSILAQAALSGEVKVSVSSGPATIASRTQGADTNIIAACVNILPYSLVAAKGITKWDQLKGKKIAISRFGSGTDTAIRLVLKRFGLDPAKDVAIVQLGTQPSRVQALAAGAIDATIISPPLDITAKKQGYQILVNIADLKIPYPQQVIEMTDRFIRENPHTAKNFLRGFIEGVRYATTYKEETKKVITKYLKTTDPEVLEATYQSFVQVTDESCYPNMEGIRNAMDEVAQRVPAVKSKKPEDFVNLRFLKELEKDGFFKEITK